MAQSDKTTADNVEQMAAAEQAAPEAEDSAAQDTAQELAQMKDKYLRLMADMENLRKRTTREVEEAHKYAVASFAREMLGIQDNLERALDAMKDEEGKEAHVHLKTLEEGVEMVRGQLEGVFKKFAIERVNAEGQKFNPELHQAMFEVPTEDHPEGTVVQQVQPGYTIAGRLLRPAMVGTAKKPQ